MKTKTNTLLGAVLSLLVLTLTTNAATQVYDLMTDWSDTQNPNGPWSYREGDDLLHSLAYGPVLAWVGSDNVTPMMSMASGYVAVLPACVPCGNGVANILWTAPCAGRIDISGDVSDSWGSSGGGYWTLSHNGNALTGGHFTGNQYVPGYSLFYFGLGSGGISALQNIPVAAGDLLVLEIGSDPDHPGLYEIGVNFAITLTPDSVDPVAAIEDLALRVVEMNLQNGIENSLDSKLDAAINALIDANFNDDGAACNSLAAFISAVEAQRGKKITSAQADQLIASAHQIRAQLNCGN